MNKTEALSVYEQVEQGTFVEGFAYTSKESDNYEVAVSFAGVDRSAFFEVGYLAKARIKELKEVNIPLFAEHPEMVEIYQNEIKRLESMLNAFERLGL